MELLKELNKAAKRPDKFQQAFQAYIIDTISPETSAIVGYTPDTGLRLSLFARETWEMFDFESEPYGVGYLLFEIALTLGPELMQQWREMTVDSPPLDRINRIEALLRRRFRQHPDWEVHKHRFMNRVTRAVKRAEKWQKQQPSS